MSRLLITGEMRSGTTFLANFLNTQEQMVVFADMLVTLFMEAHTLGVTDINRSLSDREKNVLFSNLIQEGKLHQLDFEGIDRDQELSWLQLFEAALEVIKGDEKVEIVGVKRTREEKYIGQLLEADTKVIYCIRDPRDVIFSASNRFAQFDLFTSANNWLKSYEHAGQYLDHPNFMMLKYEDLILNKIDSAERIQEFLGASVSTQMESLNWGKDKSYQDNSSFGDVRKLFDPTAVNRWKKNSSDPQVLFCERLLENEMKELGYLESSQEPGNSTEAARLTKRFHKTMRKKRFKNMVKRILRL